jgi:hypothetical protein
MSSESLTVSSKDLSQCCKSITNTDTSKTTNNTNKSSSSDINDYIGSGGFGKVYDVKGTNMVKKEMDLRHEENIREICFLSTYKHVPFITHLQSCNIDEKNNMINLFMTHAGISLRDLSKTLKIEERIKLIPTLMIQFARILIWMKQENILHCDVKPANICIDNDLNVTMIDWGFVQRILANKKYKIGTQVFYDPYTHNDIINHDSEMFAFGITLCYFVMAGFDYDEWEEFCCEFDDKDTSTFKTDPDRVCELNEKALRIINIEKTMQKFIDIHGNSDYYELIIEMINIDKDCRIKMKDLYDACPLDLQIKYPLIECYTHIDNNQMMKLNIPNTMSEKIICMVIDWMIGAKFTFNIKYSLLDAIKLLFMYIQKTHVNTSEIPTIATVCLYIANIINCEGILDLSKCAKLCNVKSRTEIINTMNKILTVLNFRVYPDRKNYEYNKKNEDIWKFTFLNSHKDLKTCKLNIHMISHDLFDSLYMQKRKNINNE